MLRVRTATLAFVLAAAAAGACFAPTAARAAGGSQQVARELIHTAYSTLALARRRVRTAPMRSAIDTQIRALDQLQHSLLGKGARVRRNRVNGSERGRVEFTTVEVPGARGRNSDGLVIMKSADGTAGVQVTRRGANHRLRLSSSGVTRALDQRGTSEIHERVLPGGRIIWTKTDYTLRGRSIKPVKVERTRYQVDAAGKLVHVLRTFTVKESGSPPSSTIERIGKLLVESRDLAPTRDGRWARPHVLSYLTARGLVDPKRVHVNAIGQTPSGKSTRVKIRIGDREIIAAVNHRTGRVQPRSASAIRDALGAL